MGRLILVVDDNQDIRDLVEQILMMRGFEVEQANGGPEALALLEEHQPDLMLLDVMMPGLSGYQVLDRIRGNANPSVSNVPVVMITAKSQAADIEKGTASGATDYLIKPFRPAALVDKVNEILDRIASEPSLQSNQKE